MRKEEKEGREEVRTDAPTCLAGLPNVCFVECTHGSFYVVVKCGV